MISASISKINEIDENILCGYLDEDITLKNIKSSNLLQEELFSELIRRTEMLTKPE